MLNSTAQAVKETVGNPVERVTQQFIGERYNTVPATIGGSVHPAVEHHPSREELAARKETSGIGANAVTASAEARTGGPGRDEKSGVSATSTRAV